MTLNRTIITLIFFSIIFLIGLLSFNDYGASIDDEHYRQNGLLTYEYLKNTVLNILYSINLIPETSASDNSLSIIEFTNPFFEVLLAFLSDMLNFEKISHIYQLSHFLNFFIFFVSLIFFYNFINKILKSQWYGFFAVIILFFSPRFFAESFYNSRDIFFLSLFILHISSAYNFLLKENLKAAILFSITSAILIDVKILGFASPIFFLFFYFLNISTERGFKKNGIKFLIFIIFSTILFIFIFWPFLWSDPIGNAIYAFNNILYHHESVTVLNYYLGEYFSSNNTPWHYRIIFFTFTTPTIVFLLFIIGLVFITSQVLKGVIKLSDPKRDIWIDINQMFNFYLLFVLIGTVFFVTKFSVAQFGGWRHLYFLYPITIVFSLIGLNYLLSIIKIRIIKNFIFLLILMNLFYIFNWCYKNHPNQQVFFNFFSKNYAMNNFDLDYWGLSNLHSIKFIAENNSYPIRVATISFSSLNESILLLNKTSKSKIKLVYDLNEADFIITNYMRKIGKNFKVDESKYTKYFEVKVDDVPINTVYKKKN